jgi:tRNA(fMet)-specific endonuclease VapC
VDLIADTTLLVGIWRKQPWAVSFARQNSSKSLGLPWVVLGEFWHGAIRAGHERKRVERFLEIGIPLLDAGSVVKDYATISAELRDSRRYREIGQNDLWIAAAAVSCNLPLVTRNERHFREIKNLKLEVVG